MDGDTRSSSSSDGRGDLSNSIALERLKGFQIKSNQIKSGLFQATWPIKSYKLVQKQRQTEKERNKNIQHTR